MAEDEQQVHWSLRRGVAPLVTLGILVAAGVVIYLATLTTSDPQPALLPTGLRSVVPSADATAPRQSPIGVNLGPAWRPTLTVNGVPVPDAELVDGTRQLGEFIIVPAEGKSIADIQPGLNCARVRAVQTVDEDVDDIDHSWCWTAF